MIGNIKSAAKGTIIYGLANVSVKLIGIILIPIYTNEKYLSKDDFGVLGIMDITFQLAVIFFGLALYQSLARWYYDPEHKSAQKSMHFTVVITNAFVCGISFLFVFGFSPKLSSLLFDTQQYSRLIWIMFASASVNIISSVSMMLLRLREEATKYAVISVAKLLITLIVTIHFVVNLRKGVTGVYEATFIGEAAGFLMIFPDIVKNSVPKFEFRKLVHMLGYGLPLMLAAVSSVLLNTIDRYSLNYLADLDAVGTYTLAFRISNTIKVVVITSIQLSLVPILFKKIGDPDLNRLISKSMNYSTLIVMFFVLCVSIFSLEITKTFAHTMSYWEAYQIIPILSFSMVFVMMKENVLIGLQITKSSKTMGSLIAITAVFNLFMNMLLIPRFVLYGAAASTIISQAVMFGLFYFIAQRKYPVPYEIKNLFLIFITGATLFLISILSNTWNIVPRMIFKLVLLGAFPLLIFLFRFFEPIEIQRIKELYRKCKHRVIR